MSNDAEQTKRESIFCNADEEKEAFLIRNDCMVGAYGSCDVHFPVVANLVVNHTRNVHRINAFTDSFIGNGKEY